MARQPGGGPRARRIDSRSCSSSVPRRSPPKTSEAAGIRLEWPSSDGWPDMWPPLEPDMGVHPLEDAHGLRQATTMYALIESAIAHAAGENRPSHNRSIGELMAGLNAVAAANPYSWFPERRERRRAHDGDSRTTGSSRLRTRST